MSETLTSTRAAAPAIPAPERCAVCGFVWDLVPYSEVASRVAESTAALRRLVAPPDRPSGWSVRLATRVQPEVWSTIEYLCHVRDVLVVQRERIISALVTDQPTFGPMHRDERVALLGYADEDLGEVLAQIESSGHLLARTLGRLDKAQFQRTLEVPFHSAGARTIEWLAAQALHEVLHHTADITAQVAPHESGLGHVRRSPADRGTLELVVRRPEVDEREVLAEGVLDVGLGLVGDNWSRRPSTKMPDRRPHPDAQLNLMNARAAALLTGERERWPLAGDQLFVDLDLSPAALPPGTRLAIGDAVIEITELPHRGCAKFAQRFGRDALRLVNSADGRALNLRGVNAKVVTGGVIRPGDAVVRVSPGGAV